MTAGDGRRRRRWGAVVAVNLAAIVAITVAAEAVLRYRGHQPYHRTFPGRHADGPGVAWARADPALGWTIEPSYLPGQINPQGFRDTKDIARSLRRAGVTRVMLLGDSFVVGAHLGSTETLPAVLQAGLGPAGEVFSLAAPGWGVDQMFLAFERYGAAVAPDIVVVAFIDDDVERVLEAYRRAERLTKPVLTVLDGGLRPQGTVASGRRRLHDVFGRSVLASLLVREVSLAGDATPVVRAIFTTIVRDMAQRGGRTIVVRIPTRDDADVINRFRRWQRRFESRLPETVDYVDAAGDGADPGAPAWPADHYVADGHLSALGTRRLADLIAGRIALVP